MKVLLIDTETTGLPKKADQYAFEQPWVIQLGAVYFDLREDRIEHTINTLVIPPEGVNFDPRAVAVHGFTEDVVRANGRDGIEVYNELRDLRRRSDIVAAYNLQFDERMIRTSSARMHPDFLDDLVLGDETEVFHHCVMEQSIAHFKARYKLGQVYKMVKGVQLTDAHDALADAVAAMEIMKELTARDFAEPGQ